LREGETGLSLFATADVSPSAVLEAVREAGKQGELAVALLTDATLRRLGLHLVAIPGGTSVAAVNATHHEARLGRFRQLWLALIRKPLHEYFNEGFSETLAREARLLD
jgi:hypothetical protein